MNNSLNYIKINIPEKGEFPFLNSSPNNHQKKSPRILITNRNHFHPFCKIPRNLRNHENHFKIFPIFVFLSFFLRRDNSSPHTPTTLKPPPWIFCQNKNYKISHKTPTVRFAFWPFLFVSFQCGADHAVKL